LRIFVSHSHADNDFGVQLVQSLRRAYGEDVVWYDSQGGLYGGDNWWHTILKELTDRAVFIVVLSPDAVKSKWVNDEITIAWDQKNSPTGKTIIPILYQDCKIRPDLKTLQYISFLPPNTYNQGFYNLMRALEAKFPRPGRTTRSLSPLPSPTPREHTQSLSSLSSTPFRRQTQSLSPPSSRTYNRKSAQSSPTTPSAPPGKKTQSLPATSPPTGSSRRKWYGSGRKWYDSGFQGGRVAPQHRQSSLLRVTRLEAIRGANRREGGQKKSPQRRLYYYENTAQVRPTPYFYDDTSSYSYEDKPPVDVPVDIKIEPESDKLPAVQRTSYLFADDPLPQEQTEQIAVPIVRRSSRLADPLYGDDDDYYFLDPEQIDQEMSPSLHTDEYPEIPRVRRASARPPVRTRVRSLARARRSNTFIQHSLSSLSALLMSNKKATCLAIGLTLFAILLATVLFAPALSGIVLLLLLILALFALLAMGYLYVNERKK
jgi:hypothetical protein